MFLNMEKWRESDIFLRSFPIAVGARPGTEEEAVKAKAAYFREKFGAHIDIAENPQIDIASSEIRKRTAEGESINYLLPEAVAEYINANKLYELT
jgi:nicotinate-nucleotide adenylyltransferase